VSFGSVVLESDDLWQDLAHRGEEIEAIETFLSIKEEKQEATLKKMRRKPIGESRLRDRWLRLINLLDFLMDFQRKLQQEKSKK
jgi:hypothetical protein